MGIFINPVDLPSGVCGDIQLAFLLGVYSYILYIGCDLISEGSELLMLTPWSKIVGSCILPVLGAVPDGAIVLFSGVGPEAQTQLDVGIGALAGSTVMLLTIPWVLAIVGGRVNIVDGEAKYVVPKGTPRLSPPDNYSLFYTGVGVMANHDAVKKMALWMIGTTVPFVIIQAAAFAASDVDDDDALSGDESVSALIAFVLAIVLFFVYLFFQWHVTQNQSNTAFDEKYIDNIVTQIKKNQIRLVAAVKPLLVQIQHTNNSKHQVDDAPLLEPTQRKMLAKVLKPFFWKYDADGNGKMDINELNRVFVDMGEKKKAAELNTLFAEFDTDQSGFIEFAEFVEGVKNYVFRHENLGETGQQAEEGEEGKAEEEEQDEDEEEVPEDLKDLSPEEQQKAVLSRAKYMLFTGTVIVLVFSDPLVNVLDEIATRTNIEPFYVAFILAPIVTNGSELMASYTFALKKTSPSIVCSFQQLLGAAVMNNTYCVGIFMGLIYFQRLYWTFTSETIAILFVESVMLCYAWKSVHRLFDGFCVLLLYPISLGIVAALNSIGL